AICKGRGGRWTRRCSSRRRLVELLIKGLQRAGGLLAAWNAEIEPLLLPQEDDVRIVLAVVAALAAILLSHRRHHPPPQRLALGKFHALDERQRLVVPGRLPVVGVIERPFCRGGQARHERSVRLQRKRGHVRIAKLK